MDKKVILKKGFRSMLSVIASFALLLTTINVNSACWYIMHQDEIPEEAKKFRKF